MDAAQAVAHCATSMEWAVGDKKPPRMFVGRVLGVVIKPLVLKDDAPMRKNSPTSPDLVIADARDLERGTGARCADCSTDLSQPGRPDARGIRTASSDG